MDSLGGLPVNVEHVPHAVHTSTRSGTSTSCNESRPLALSDDETAGAVTRDTAQRMNAGAIRQPSASWRGKCYVIRAFPTLGNPSMNQLPVGQMFDNMTRRRADTVSTCCNGPSLWRPRAVRQSLPAFQFECGYACGRKHSAGGDSGRGNFQATIWRDRASSHN